MTIPSVPAIPEMLDDLENAVYSDALHSTGQTRAEIASARKAIIEELSRLKAGDEWRTDMENAPADGTPVLLATNKEVVEGYWDATNFLWRDRFYMTSFSYGWFTYWMPRPALPPAPGGRPVR